MKRKSKLMTTEEMIRALKRISHQIVEKNGGTEDIVIVGILQGGEPIAMQLVQHLKAIEGVDVPFGTLDITHYRDDLTEFSEPPTVNGTALPFDVTEKHVILVDDVLYTGRTARAALDAVSTYGRAKTIQLAVLIDRGHRELPIRADFVGKNVPTSRDEIISVDIDCETNMPCVNLYEKNS
ncbi:pyrimidine operon attenuation protein/uracil phosphoribosyltransferase [Clostridiales Family XIII bacterium PM5-7]